MHLLIQLIEIYSIVVLARAILSWVRPYPGTEIERMLYRVTEPALEPIRQILPSMGGLDFSPLALFLLLRMLSSIIMRAGM